MTNLVPLFPNLFRALEIAKVGGFFVSVYLVDTDYSSGFDDYKTIKAFCKGWFDCFSQNDSESIKVCICKPNNYTPTLFSENNNETIETISKRIKKAIQFERPVLDLSNGGDTLLKNATRILDLSLSQVEKIKRIAITIAQMDSSAVTKPEHIAEAINYIHINEKAIPATSKFICFGSKIKIKKGYIEKETIEKAIEFLNGLL